jgi:hypothetical protein
MHANPKTNNKSNKEGKRRMEPQSKVVLVTGGTGLVGSAIHDFVNGDKYAKGSETWVFLGSGDADLR